MSIVGGCDTVLGIVLVHEVYPDGAAAHDGRLKPGDQILEVNGQSLMEVGHEKAIAILRKTPSKARLLVYRDTNLQLSLLDPTQIYNIFHIELMKRPGRGLGLSIVGMIHHFYYYLLEYSSMCRCSTLARFRQKIGARSVRERGCQGRCSRG